MYDSMRTLEEEAAGFVIGELPEFQPVHSEIPEKFSYVNETIKPQKVYLQISKYIYALKMRIPPGNHKYTVQKVDSNKRWSQMAILDTLADLNAWIVQYRQKDDVC